MSFGVTNEFFVLPAWQLSAGSSFLLSLALFGCVLGWPYVNVCTVHIYVRRPSSFFELHNRWRSNCATSTKTPSPTRYLVYRVYSNEASVNR